MRPLILAFFSLALIFALSFFHYRVFLDKYVSEHRFFLLNSSCNSTDLFPENSYKVFKRIVGSEFYRSASGQPIISIPKKIFRETVALNSFPSRFAHNYCPATSTYDQTRNFSFLAKAENWVVKISDLIRYPKTKVIHGLNDYRWEKLSCNNYDIPFDIYFRRNLDIEFYGQENVFLQRIAYEKKAIKRNVILSLSDPIEQNFHFLNKHFPQIFILYLTLGIIITLSYFSSKGLPQSDKLA